MLHAFIHSSSYTSWPACCSRSATPRPRCETRDREKTWPPAVLGRLRGCATALHVHEPWRGICNSTDLASIAHHRQLARSISVVNIGSSPEREENKVPPGSSHFGARFRDCTHRMCVAVLSKSSTSAVVLWSLYFLWGGASPPAAPASVEQRSWLQRTVAVPYTSERKNEQRAFRLWAGGIPCVEAIFVGVGRG